MTTITPQQARRSIDRAEVLTILADVHNAWGEAAWNSGDYRGAVRNWQAAAKHYLAAEREDGAKC